jgi:hypothetical protein
VAAHFDPAAQSRILRFEDGIPKFTSAETKHERDRETDTPGSTGHPFDT